MMMRVILLCCVAAASAAVTEPRVLLKLSPLIGGPKLLRVHSQLFVDSGAGIDGWDFVPKDATAPATLARLVTLRAAPGDARRLVANDGVGMYDVGAAAASSAVWKSASVSGAPDNSSLSHFSAMTWPRWFRRAVRNRHRRAIEQALRRWR
jgi:hypothetical protein